MESRKNPNEIKLTKGSMPMTPPNVFRLSQNASFTIEDIPNNPNNKKITYVYTDPNKSYGDNIMLVTFPPDSKPNSPYPLEEPMYYDEKSRSYRITVERGNNVGEKFLITTAKEPGKKENPNALQLERGVISLKNGMMQPVNKGLDKAPEGKLQNFLLTGTGEIHKTNHRDEHKLEKGERFITIYTPPGYESDPKKLNPYDLQINLDGGSYLDIMQMNVVLDNLTAKNEISPTVVVFISPHSGPPDERKKGFETVMPPGYSLSMRLKEYCCNADFADMLAVLPAKVRRQFNTTNDPRHTTIWGLSAGGLQASYTGLLHPEVFGNVVAQSPMAWNIPEQNIATDAKVLENGEHWRQGIVDKEIVAVQEGKKISKDITWSTSTAKLPPKETDHNEYLTQIVVNGKDEITGRSINPNSLRFYFDAGEKERAYDPEEGTANLVKATELFAEALEAKGATVIDHQVHLLGGGHHNMTWMRNIADISRTIHAPAPKLKLQESKELQQDRDAEGTPLSSTARTATLLGATPSALTQTASVSGKEDKKVVLKTAQSSAHHRKKSKGVDITDEEMTKSDFGQGSDTAKKMERK